MVSASVLKTAALCWLRYGKRMPIVCTEVGRWYADVVGMSPTQAIEVEVKRSKADLKAEFRNKTAKQYLYQNAKETSGHVPNYFYFLVPKELGEEALAVAEAGNPKAGILSYDTEVAPGVRGAVSVIKKAARLKESPPGKVMLTMAMMRCSSEVCGLHQSYDKLSESFADVVNNIRDESLTLVARGSGTLDYEIGLEDLELRARELAYCVESVSEEQWQAMDEEGHRKWLEAATRLLDAQYVNAKGWIDAPFLY